MLFSFRLPFKFFFDVLDLNFLLPLLGVVIIIITIYIKRARKADKIGIRDVIFPILFFLFLYTISSYFYSNPELFILVFVPLVLHTLEDTLFVYLICFCREYIYDNLLYSERYIRSIYREYLKSKVIFFQGKKVVLNKPLKGLKLKYYVMAQYYYECYGINEEVLKTYPKKVKTYPKEANTYVTMDNSSNASGEDQGGPSNSSSGSTKPSGSSSSGALVRSNSGNVPNAYSKWNYSKTREIEKIDSKLLVNTIYHNPNAGPVYIVDIHTTNNNITNRYTTYDVVPGSFTVNTDQDL
jgi:hypothetical protein